MIKISKRIGLYLAINLIILTICFLHLPAIFNRPMVPFHLISTGQGLLIDKIINPPAAGELKTGDRVMAWDDHTLNVPEITEFLAEMSSIGDSAVVTFERQGKTAQTGIVLIPFHATLRYLFIIFFTGLITWCVAIFVLLNAPPDLCTTVLHWSLASFGFVIMLTTGIIYPQNILSYITRFLFLIFYMTTVSGLFYFSAIFPVPRGKALKALLIFVPVTVFTCLLVWYHLKSIYFYSIADYEKFQYLFNILHISLYAFISGSLLNFFHSYYTSKQTEDRRSLQLIFWGIVVGAAPFLLLSILPQILGRGELIREEFTLVFFILIPLTFTLAILKYRLLDIKSIINRILVYSLLTFFLGAIYIVTVLMVISVIGGEIVFDDYLFLLLTTLFIAIIFNPLRRGLQKIINDLFFSARENYRQAIQSIGSDLENCWSSDALFHQLAIALNRFVPSRQLAVFRAAGNTLQLQYSSGDGIPDQISLPGTDLQQIISGGRIYALPKAVYLHPEQADFSQSDFLQQINFPVCIPLVTKTSYFKGFLCAVPYHGRYINAELDLLHAACLQVEEVLDRLLLQERMIIEREEKKRLKEISSYIVSLVAHELQSPLTSIRLFSEMLLQQDKNLSAEQREYLGIIGAETMRMSRLIKNVLDFSRIDRGLKEYHFEILTLNRLIEHTVNIFKQQLEQEGFNLELDLTGEDTTIRADEDAMISALGNLIANSIKYSPSEKYLGVSTRCRNGQIHLCIKDRGRGIPAAEQTLVFNDFYRSNNSQVQSLSGLGLGLALVKRIISAHQGEIVLESAPGRGTAFTIILPAGV